MVKKQSIEELVKIELKDCRFHADCMALKVKQLRKKNKIINSLLAISSSASIASWAIWNDLAMLWGCIIAVSQVITALKPVFHFGKHVPHSIQDATSKRRYFLTWIIFGMS